MYNVPMQQHTLNGGRVIETPHGWRLEIPPGEAGTYRLAQLDDYHGLARRAFPHQPPCRIEVQARAGISHPAGTWGIGLWNDPFSLGISGPPDRWRWPVLPQAAWFFFASPPNYLAFREDQPARGWLAGTFAARPLPWPLLLMGGLGLPLLWLPLTRRMLRRLAAAWVPQSGVALPAPGTEWHTLVLQWESQRTRFWVDGDLVLNTRCTPRPPLGLVLWLDNQYAAWEPGTAPRFGTLATGQTTWVEFQHLKVQ